MRLKPKFVMIIILVALLVSICLGIKFTDKKQDNEVEIIEDVVPSTFCKGIANASDVPSEALDIIKAYFDDYFKSIYSLEAIDTTRYFENEKLAQVSNYAIKLTVETRKLYDFDFTMSDASYTLNITDCFVDDDTVKIDFLEDDVMCFSFLNGISSESYDIENAITLKKIDGEYKISDYEKTQGYYLMFYDEINEDLDKVYETYFEELNYSINRNKENKIKAQENPYLASRNYSIKYDRQAAVDYANTYYHSRNDEWYDFSEQGNCQNYASQVLIAGGMKMDYDGDEYYGDIWYYNDNGDYTSSWTGVPYFHNYCKDYDNDALITDADINIYYAEPGDIVHVGISGVSHATVVSKIVDGHILLNSNSIDMKDFPVEAYTYPTIKLIKILGCNGTVKLKVE